MSTTPPVIETPQPSAAATPVSDKRTAATGVIPKQMQSWIFLAIIGVVAVGLWFSSSGQKTKSAGANGPGAGEQVKPIVGGLSPDEVQRRVQESEEARRTALTNPVLNQSVRPGDSPNQDATVSGTNQPAQPQAPTSDPIAEDERKREYVSRFASNLATSYRADPHSGNPGAHPTNNALSSASSTEDLAAAAQNPALPANFPQQLEALQGQQQKLLAQQQQLATAAALPAGAQPQQQQQPPATPPSTRKNVDMNAATGKDHIIFEGTVLESVLVNLLNADFAG